MEMGGGVGKHIKATNHLLQVALELLRSHIQYVSHNLATPTIEEGASSQGQRQ